MKSKRAIVFQWSFTVTKRLIQIERNVKSLTPLLDVIVKANRITPSALKCDVPINQLSHFF